VEIDAGFNQSHYLGTVISSIKTCISIKQCQCRSTDYWEDDTISRGDNRYMIYCNRRVSGMIFIRYSHSQKIGKKNDLSLGDLLYVFVYAIIWVIRIMVLCDKSICLSAVNMSLTNLQFAITNIAFTLLICITPF